MAVSLAKVREEHSHDSSAIILPSVRTFQTWTPSLLRSAEISADAGNIRLAVDICDWILGDDKVRGALDGRANGVFSQPLTFAPHGDGRRQTRTIKDLDKGGDWKAIFPDSQEMQVYSWGILLNFGPFVLRWDQQEEQGNRDIPRIEFYHPQPMRWEWTTRTWLVRTNGGTGNEVPIEFGDGVWCSHMPFGEYRPWSMGLWRAIARWVLLKQYAIQDWGRLGESASRNVVEADKDTRSTKDLRSELADSLAGMGRDGSIVLPPGFTYELVEATAGTKEIYQSQITMADTAIAIAIRGSNLTTMVSGGSRSAAEVHERGDLANARRDARAWSATTRCQVLIHWAASNYGDPKLAPIPEYATEPEEDRKAKAEVLVSATTGVTQAEALGFELDRKGFIEEFELSGFLKPGAKPESVEPPPAPDPNAPPPDDPPPDNRAAALLDDPQAAGVVAEPGTDDGQQYADRVKDKMTGHAARTLAPTVAAMIAQVRKAKSYDEARTLIQERYAKLAPPTELAELTEAALTMVSLGGHLAIDEEE